jgi:serpin B
MLFLSIIGTNESFGDRICKAEFVMILKASTLTEVCVKPATSEKLIQRGWGIMPEQSTTEPTKPSMTEPTKPSTTEPTKPSTTEPTKPSTTEETDMTKLVDANNRFSMDFYSEISDNNEDNIFFSPLSISNAFAIAYEGSRGLTADEIRNTFYFLDDDSELRNSFAKLLESLNSKKSEYVLRMGNALWLAEGFEPKSEYVANAQNYYKSEVATVNFITNDGVETINEWVKLKTENKIPKLLSDGSTDDSTRLYITNAIYFKGDWIHQFNKDRTIDDNFIVNKETIVKVPMMTNSQDKYPYFANQNLQILEMPYEGEELSMLIILPNDNDGLKAVEDTLNIQNLQNWKTQLRESKLFVQIPKFSLETTYDLKENLSSMGIEVAFDPNLADLTGISDSSDLYIEKAIHKAFVEVNEEGTEAAASTGIGVGVTSAPPTFRADHPFIFLIQENESGNILFMGRIINPTE